MATSLSQRLSALLGRVRVWLGREHPDPPVNIDDPMGGALSDAELLIAFAAQSRRSIDPKKVQELALHAARMHELRNARLAIPAAESAAFWAAYDAFAVAMDPLSAHSIRASLRMNRMRFPRSLLTPTAINAVLALLVFYVFLSLQSFWVAGKEMVERADALEQEKAELATRLVANRAALDEAARKRWSRWRDRCNAAGECGERPGPRTGNPVRVAGPTSPAVLATLDAEIRLLEDGFNDKERQQRTLIEQHGALAVRSQPLEALMASWYARSLSVCGTSLPLPWVELRPMAFICSLKETSAPPQGAQAGAAQQDPNTQPDARRMQKRARLEKLQDEAEAQQDQRIADLELVVSKLPPVEPTATGLQSTTASAERQMMRYAAQPGPRDELKMLRQERQRTLAEQVAEMDTRRFGRVSAEVRMIVANLGTYLIALVMGLLGALTYILRTLSLQLREHTYVPVAISESVIRICLGAIAGVFGSLLVPSAGAELKSLPPIFVPFIFGYGIEILFSMLDRVVRSFTQGDGTAGGARG